MKTVISSKGQIVLPAELRARDRIRSGQRFDIERLEAGKYLLTKHAQTNRGFVDEWLACPYKVELAPLESESTDTL